MTIQVPFKEFIYLPVLGLSFSMQNIQSLLKHVGSFSCSMQDLMEKEMATYASILAWRIPFDRRVWQTAVYGVPKSQT